MTNFVETIKRISVAAVEATKPVAVVFGTVTETNPLKIQLALGQEYPKEFFLALTRPRNWNMEKGDILVLLRIQGGQQYLILGKKGDL